MWFRQGGGLADTNIRADRISSSLTGRVVMVVPQTRTDKAQRAAASTADRLRHAHKQHSSRCRERSERMFDTQSASGRFRRGGQAISCSCTSYTCRRQYVGRHVSALSRASAGRSLRRQHMCATSGWTAVTRTRHRCFVGRPSARFIMTWRTQIETLTGSSSTAHHRHQL
jgi:hypothetical protein